MDAVLEQRIYEEQMSTFYAQQNTAAEQARPCVVFQAMLRYNMAYVYNRDKNPAAFLPDCDWIAEYGDLQAFGSTPAQAMENFDKQWKERKS